MLLGASVGCLAVTYWLARIGAKPAAWVMFVTEILATIAMLVVFVAVLITHRGDWFDSTQLQLVLQRRRPRAVVHSGCVAHRRVQLGGSHDVHDERRRCRPPRRGRTSIRRIRYLAFVLYKNLVPFPGWPSNLVVALFVGASVAICISYVRLHSRSPVLDRIGTTVVEDDAALPANAVPTTTP